MSSLLHPPYDTLHLLKNLTQLAYHITFQPFTTQYSTFIHSCQLMHSIHSYGNHLLLQMYIPISSTSQSLSFMLNSPLPLILILHYCWSHFSNTCISTTPPSSPLVVSIPKDFSPSLPFVFHIVPLANALSIVSQFSLLLSNTLAHTLVFHLQYVACRDIWKNDTYFGLVNIHGYSRGPKFFRAMDAIWAL